MKQFAYSNNLYYLCTQIIIIIKNPLSQKTTFRQDIALLRTFAILAIVLHHSFCIYYGWPTQIYKITSVTAGIVCSFSKTFGLSVFTFISGYLIFAKQGQVKLLSFLENKVLRLLLPALVWGVLYHLVFTKYEISQFPSFINGNHLWFIPMIFLCMLMVRPLLTGNRYAVIIILAISVIMQRYNYINRTFGEYSSYFPIFMTGYTLAAIENHKTLEKQVFLNIVGVLLGMTFLTGTHQHLGELAICLVAYIAAQAIRGKDYKLLKVMNEYSFAIYLLHQFVINTFLATNTYFTSGLWWLNVLIIAPTAVLVPMCIKWIFTLTYRRIPFMKNIL